MSEEIPLESCEGDTLKPKLEDLTEESFRPYVDNISSLN